MVIKSCPLLVKDTETCVGSSLASYFVLFSFRFCWFRFRWFRFALYRYPANITQDPEKKLFKNDSLKSLHHCWDDPQPIFCCFLTIENVLLYFIQTLLSHICSLFLLCFSLVKTSNNLLCNILSHIKLVCSVTFYHINHLWTFLK